MLYDPIRLLLIEDVREDYLAIQQLLSRVPGQRYLLEWAETGAEGRAAVAAGQHDLYLIDYLLPDVDGIELLRELKAEGCPRPIILLTGQGGYEVDVAAMRAGAADFLLKSELTAALLERAIRYALERQRTTDELRAIAARAHCLIWRADVTEIGEADLVWDIHPADEDAAQRFFPLDVPPGTAYSRAWHDSRPVEDRLRTDAYGSEQTRAGRSYTQEFRCRDREGNLRWMHEDVQIETVAPGRWRAVGICTDITERKRAEETLRFQAHLLDAVGQAVIATDLPGAVLYWNHAAEELYGWTAHEALGRNIMELTPSEASREQAAEIMERLRAGESWSGEFPLQRRDGSTFLALVTDTPIHADNGELFGIVGVSMDRTAQIRAEERLRESETRFRVICDESPVGIFLTDEEGRCVYSNVVTCSLTGRPEEQLVGHGWVQSIHPDDRERMVPEWRAAHAAGRGFENECRFQRPDGGVVCVRIRATPVWDGETLRGHVGLCEDVTERALLDEQLRQTQKMEAVGQLAGGVAHDFNNMLAVITGYSELALNRLPEDHSVCAFLKEVHRAGERASDLTRQLLAFSRRQVLAPKPINLAEAVLSIHPMLRRLIGADVELVAVPGASASWVRADPGQIEQVIVNLAVNARDAMPDGGRLTLGVQALQSNRAFVRTRPHAQPGRYVLLTVADTGCGMDAATRSRIFEPFFTTKEPGKGTGLGLATVYGIVRQSGGWIEVESEPGCGSTFRVFLPQIEAPAHTERAVATPILPRGTETVLLVEDEPMVRGLASEVLRRCGYTVLVAAQGEEALEIAARHAGVIHLLLTDVVMPIMGGRALAERCRAVRPDMQVLFMSGYTGDTVAPRDGATPGAFIQKPFTPLALARKVRELLDGPVAPAEPRPARGTILIIDDDAAARESLADVLQDAGYAAMTAPDGARGLEYLHTHPAPDLILLDLHMPSMNGWVFRTEQQRDAVLAGIPIVVLSGVHDPAGAKGYLDAVGHITKPVDAERLLAVVREHCGSLSSPLVR